MFSGLSIQYSFVKTICWWVIGSRCRGGTWIGTRTDGKGGISPRFRISVDANISSRLRTGDHGGISSKFRLVLKGARKAISSKFRLRALTGVLTDICSGVSSRARVGVSSRSRDNIADFRINNTRLQSVLSGQAKKATVMDFHIKINQLVTISIFYILIYNVKK